MERVPPLPPLKPWRSHADFGMALVAGTLAAGNIGLGLSLILGGPLRLSAPAFDYLREVAGGIPWGIAFVLVGGLALLGQIIPRLWPLASVGHFLAGGLLGFWTYSFVRVADNPRAAVTGIGVYLTLALCHWIVSVASKPEPPR